MKIRRVIFNFEPYIVKDFGKNNLNLHIVSFKVFNNRGKFMSEIWNIYHLHLEILNFSISIDYEI
jgi:hypothetical protein